MKPIVQVNWKSQKCLTEDILQASVVEIEDSLIILT